MVTTSMTVPVLAQSIARLLSVSSPIALFVFPRWELLDHEGFIVSRFLPGTDTPCPFLQPGSTIRVLVRSRLARLPSSSSGSSIFGSAPALLFDDGALRLAGSSFPTLHETPPSDSSVLRLAGSFFSTLHETPPSESSVDDAALRLDQSDFYVSFGEEGQDESRGDSALKRSISNLQRNGENSSDGVRRVSFGLQIQRQQSPPSSKVSQFRLKFLKPLLLLRGTTL
jgi:hypothetical protein